MQKKCPPKSLNSRKTKGPSRWEMQTEKRVGDTHKRQTSKEKRETKEVTIDTKKKSRIKPEKRRGGWRRQWTADKRRIETKTKRDRQKKTKGTEREKIKHLPPAAK